MKSAILQMARLCCFASIAAFVAASAAFSTASRSHCSISSRSALAFFRWSRRVSVSTVVSERRRTAARSFSFASGSGNPHRRWEEDAAVSAASTLSLLAAFRGGQCAPPILASASMASMARHEHPLMPVRSHRRRGRRRASGKQRVAGRAR